MGAETMRVALLAEALRERARNLAAQLATGEAVDLLTVIDPETATSQQFDCLAAFAHAVGHNAPGPQPVHVRLLDGTFPAAVHLLSGLLQAWPQECFAWLSTNITTGHVAELALWIADELAAGQETTLLDAVTAQLTIARSGNGAGTDAGQASEDDTPGPGDEDPGGPDPGLAVLTARVADHLGWCRAQPADRLNRLVTLSSTAPDDVLPRILAAVDRILGPPSGTHALDGEDGSALRRELTGILARALRCSGCSRLMDEGETAARRRRRRHLP